VSKKWKITLTVGSIVVALVVAAVAVTGYALAQQPPPPQSGESDFPGPGIGGREGRRAGRGPGQPNWMEPYQDQIQEAVAEALGISVEELEAARDEGKTLRDIAEEQGVEFADVQAALKAARLEAIEQAVADGVISKEMAERLIERMEQTPPAGWMEPYHDQMQEAIAEALGISVEELEAAQDEGQSPAEIAKELGIDLDEFRQAMQDAREEIHEQAVADGVLTPEQAERLSQGQGHRPGPRPGIGLDCDCRCRCRGERIGQGGQFRPEPSDSGE
jgi:DNA-directed RNA polymerase specialized sigma24 family protein